jgi:hypothetical protein
MSTITGVTGPNSVLGVHATLAAAGVTHGPEPPTQTPAATRGISKTGDFMQKLQKLLEVDPSSFQAMMNKLANELESAAAKASGQDASFLSRLADTFRLAGSAKSLSPLRPAAATSPPVTSFGSYAQGGHRAGAGMLKTFVAQAIAKVDMVLTPPEPEPMPPAPVQ